MSWVTSLMLHISPIEEDATALAEAVNAFFLDFPHPVTGASRCDEGMAPMSPRVPGGKCFGAAIWVGAYNYFPLDAFLAHLRTLPWDPDRCSQLFVMDEEDLSFRVIALGPE